MVDLYFHHGYHSDADDKKVWNTIFYTNLNLNFIELYSIKMNHVDVKYCSIVDRVT